MPVLSSSHSAASHQGPSTARPAYSPRPSPPSAAQPDGPDWSSPPLNVAGKVDGAANGAPLRLVWEYEGNVPGNWHDMGRANSDIHNAAVSEGRRFLKFGRYGRYRAGALRYCSDLVLMKQCNLATGKIRAIRRVATFMTPAPFADGTVEVVCEYE